MEKITTLQISTTYENLGELTEKTENIWLVCHGYGQLAKYFIRRFDILDLEKNYVIAPQGLSKFYIDGSYRKVGASWLTKENREMDLQNTLTYLRFIYENEVVKPLQRFLEYNKNYSNNLKINLLGFSQGAAMISRWAVACQIPFDKLVIWGGRFPDEIQQEQLNFVKPSSEIILVIGDKDEFYQQNYIDEETTKLTNKFTELIKTPQLIVFDGIHEVRRDILQQIV